ncbi:sodium:proton antiporter [bacterium]|nr:sodium:proton antiporter [bacterium]
MPLLISFCPHATGGLADCAACLILLYMLYIHAPAWRERANRKGLMAIHGDLPLLTTLTLGFSAAFICGLIACKLRMSPIVGYLIGGILIGPHTPGVMADLAIARQLSEIGIILLMFGVGLHFSVKDLMEVRHIALPGAIAQIAVATLMGCVVAHFWNWPVISSMMLGLALSVASTVVLLRALEEHHLLESTNGNIAIGWLIVEDIAMVLALVLIPALAAHPAENLQADLEVVKEMVLAISKMVVFVGVMSLAGKRLFPWLLMSVANTRSRELFTLSVFAVALGVALCAAKLFGISFALGAFFAGMMIRESDLSLEAAEKALPMQDAFAVLFFVSVGMLFNPMILLEKPVQVLWVVAIIVIGKSLAAMAIILMFRYPFKTALIVSAGLAQIGEFSFILANISVARNLIPDDGRDLILAGALISISLNPALFYVSRLLPEWVARHPRLSRLLNMHDDSLSHLEPGEEKSLKDLVIVVGHGRVGKHISAHIQSSQFDLVVVDSNRERIETLRESGTLAIAGDATQPLTLKEAAIHKATAILVAVPNPFEARHIVMTARTINPHIKVLVRAHNDEEMQYFIAQQVDLAVMGPREVGRRMVEFLCDAAIESPSNPTGNKRKPS